MVLVVLLLDLMVVVIDGDLDSRHVVRVSAVVVVFMSRSALFLRMMRLL